MGRNQAPAEKFAASISVSCRTRSVRDAALDSLRDSFRDCERELSDPMNEGREPTLLLLCRPFKESM
jgi:hypothetical protein